MNYFTRLFTFETRRFFIKCNTLPDEIDMFEAKYVKNYNIIIIFNQENSYHQQGCFSMKSCNITYDIKENVLLLFPHVYRLYKACFSLIKNACLSGPRSMQTRAYFWTRHIFLLYLYSIWYRLNVVCVMSAPKVLYGVPFRSKLYELREYIETMHRTYQITRYEVDSCKFKFKLKKIKRKSQS